MYRPIRKMSRVAGTIASASMPLRQQAAPRPAPRCASASSGCSARRRRATARPDCAGPRGRRRTAVDRAQHRDRLVGHRPPVLLGDKVEPGLHVAAGDAVERPGEPVAEAAPHVAAVEDFRRRLPLRAGLHVIFECLFERRHAARLGALFRRVLPSGDTSQQILCLPPRLVGCDASVAPDDHALVGRLAPAVAGAVIDDEGLGAGRLDAAPEPGQLVVPRDPGLFGGLQRLDGALGQGEPDLGDALAGMSFALHAAMIEPGANLINTIVNTRKEIGAHAGASESSFKLPKFS